MSSTLRSVALVFGLAFFALVPAARGSGGFNVDFGDEFGAPSAGYGAASGQAGIWNEAVLGTTALVDLSGVASGVSVTVTASFPNGPGSQTPTNDDELLLHDGTLLFSADPNIWSVTFTGLGDGDYLVYLYAPRLGASVPTGPMTVGGSAAASLPGSISTLIEGMSWVRVPVTVSGGTLVISGGVLSASLAYGSLGGLQIVPLSGPGSYCTSGTSASGCQAVVAATGTPSATAPAGFDLLAWRVEGAKDGIFYFGTAGRQANPWGNGTSFQCVIPPVQRGALMLGLGSSLACDGSFTQDLNALWCPTCPRPLQNPGAGAVVQAQLWYRDPWNTSLQTASLSNAIEFTVGP